MDSGLARNIAVLALAGLILSLGVVGNAAATPSDPVTSVVEEASECVYVSTEPPDADVDPLNCIPTGG